MMAIMLRASLILTQLDMMSFLRVKDIWMWFIFQQVNTIIYFPRSLHIHSFKCEEIKFSFLAYLGTIVVDVVSNFVG